MTRLAIVTAFYHVKLFLHSNRNTIHKRQGLSFSIPSSGYRCHLKNNNNNMHLTTCRNCHCMICPEQALQKNSLFPCCILTSWYALTFKTSSLLCCTMAFNLGVCFSMSSMISITLSAICIGVTCCNLHHKFQTINDAYWFQIK